MNKFKVPKMIGKPFPWWIWAQRDPLTGITTIRRFWWFGHLRIAWHRFRFWTWERGTNRG